jgi:hypothetical protein
MPYVFDTNSIAALSHYYPKRFPTFWALFNDAVAAEDVISVNVCDHFEIKWANLEGFLSENDWEF